MLISALRCIDSGPILMIITCETLQCIYRNQMNRLRCCKPSQHSSCICECVVYFHNYSISLSKKQDKTLPVELIFFVIFCTCCRCTTKKHLTMASPVGDSPRSSCSADTMSQLLTATVHSLNNSVSNPACVALSCSTWRHFF